MSNAYDVTVTKSAGTPSGLRAARKLALGEAREAVSRGYTSGEIRVKYDTVVYVLATDGIHRLVKSPDGRTLSDRRIP